MAEQVDAADLKSVVRKDVPVRFWLGAPIKKGHFMCLFFIGRLKTDRTGRVPVWNRNFQAFFKNAGLRSRENKIGEAKLARCTI